MNELFVILYLIINIFVFILYGVDKYKAIHENYRISEKALILSALFGPFGAYAGMRIFRHKIRKPLFSIIIPVFVLIHIVLMAGIYTGLI